MMAELPYAIAATGLAPPSARGSRILSCQGRRAGSDFAWFATGVRMGQYSIGAT